LKKGTVRPTWKEHQNSGMGALSWYRCSKEKMARGKVEEKQQSRFTAPVLRMVTQQKEKNQQRGGSDATEMRKGKERIALPPDLSTVVGPAYTTR